MYTTNQIADSYVKAVKHGYGAVKHVVKAIFLNPDFDKKIKPKTRYGLSCGVIYLLKELGKTEDVLNNKSKLIRSINELNTIAAELLSVINESDLVVPGDENYVFYTKTNDLEFLTHSDAVARLLALTREALEELFNTSVLDHIAPTELASIRWPLFKVISFSITLLEWEHLETLKTHAQSASDVPNYLYDGFNMAALISTMTEQLKVHKTRISLTKNKPKT